MSKQINFTEKQIQFLQLISSGKSEMDAARTVWGTKGSYFGHRRWRKNSKIVTEIVKIQKSIIDKAGVTRQDVIDGILEAINQARCAEDPMGQIAGWRELNKMCGYYEPEKHVHEHSHHIAELENLSTARLLELANEDAITLKKADYEIVETEVDVGHAA